MIKCCGESYKTKEKSCIQSLDQSSVCALLPLVKIRNFTTSASTENIC